MNDTLEQSTSYSPASVVINVRADIQLELRNLSSKLSNGGIVVFERSCTSFLVARFSLVKPHIFNFSCEIARQQEVLTGRRLGEFQPRKLNNSSSLLLDIEVGGGVIATDAITNIGRQIW